VKRCAKLHIPDLEMLTDTWFPRFSGGIVNKTCRAVLS